MSSGTDLRALVDNAMWSRDVDRLHSVAPCRCCCSDHTFDDCAARAWFGCRGQSSPTWAEREADLEAWVRHYAKFHGLSRAEFFS